MAEYIEREAAVKLLRDTAAEGYPTPFHIGLYAAARAIEALPAADVRPVVFCRDCKYAERTGMADGCVWCNENLIVRLDDDFCSHGEKREES